MATKQIIIDISEIKLARLTCPNEKCGAVLEFAIPPMHEPTGCPHCNGRFIGSLASMMKFLEYMAQTHRDGLKLAFVIPDIPAK